MSVDDPQGSLPTEHAETDCADPSATKLDAQVEVAEASSQSVIPPLVVESPEAKKAVDQRRVIARLIVTPGESTLEINPASTGIEIVANAGVAPPGVAYQVYENATIRVGRSKSNDLVVTDRDVSRFHATFNTSASGVVLSDLSSTNGTFVNTRRLTTPIDLVSGDTVTFGNITTAVSLHIADGGGEHDGTTTALADLRAVEVTVLLADIVSYTRMSQVLPTDDVAKMLRVWFERVGPIIERYGGEIDKYIGDCVMAIWRSGREGAVHAAESAVQAGLEIIAETDQLNGESAWSHGVQFPWRCRTALNSGTALFGNVGTTDQRNYTVLGDAVNIAFRVESLAGKLNKSMLAAENSVSLIKDRFEMERLGSFALEGRAEEVSIYSITGKKSG